LAKPFGTLITEGEYYNVERQRKFFSQQCNSKEIGFSLELLGHHYLKVGLHILLGILFLSLLFQNKSNILPYLHNVFVEGCMGHSDYMPLVQGYSTSL